MGKMRSKVTNRKREKNMKKSLVKQKKKKHSVVSLTRIMRPTGEELEFRKTKSRADLEKHSKYFKCTKCQTSFKNIINEQGKVCVHPLLGVLMCQGCCDYYGDGNFSLDSDGEDKYCRWCGEGGTLFTCSKCICGFCDVCLKKHFGNDYYKKVQKDDDWVCLFCNPEPLWHLRFISSLAEELSKNSNKQPLKIEVGPKSSRQNLAFNKKKPLRGKTELENKNNIEKDTSEDSTDDESEDLRAYSKRLKFSDTLDKGVADSAFEIKKSQTIESLEKVLKLSEHHMAFGLKWSSNTLARLTDSQRFTNSAKLKKECQKIKWFLSVLSTYLVGFSNSIDTVEKNIDGVCESPNTSRPFAELQSYAVITQFLGFITNQVKAFSEKGISLQNLMEAEIYEDEDVLGFKKKASSDMSRSNNSDSAYDDISLMKETHTVTEKGIEDLQPGTSKEGEESICLLEGGERERMISTDHVEKKNEELINEAVEEGNLRGESSTEKKNLNFQVENSIKYIERILSGEDELRKEENKEF